MNTEADDFVEIERGSTKPIEAAIAMKTISMRGGAERISLTFSEAAIAKLEGWPRFSVAWSSKTLTFRVRADPAGAFEACKTPKGSRYMLRFQLPPEAKVVPKLSEPAPHRYAEDGKTLFVTLPPAFRRPLNHEQMVAKAREAIPAPHFGGRRA